ncbi:MAG: CarD family transcriptional regulator [Hespellia sp.]|nr:CarD family transcriptional regulator [Hespellia sp.]
MLSIGDKVVHSPEGVCKVEEICILEMQKQKRKYYRLRSIVDDKIVVYIPTDNTKIQTRELKSREEIQSILQLEPDGTKFLQQNMQKRAAVQKKAIYEDNSALVMKLIKLYVRKNEQAYLSIMDKNWLKLAERYLFSEIAEVMGCEYAAFVQESHRNICFS